MNTHCTPSVCGSVKEHEISFPRSILSLKWDVCYSHINFENTHGRNNSLMFSFNERNLQQNKGTSMVRRCVFSLCVVS